MHRASPIILLTCLFLWSHDQIDSANVGSDYNSRLLHLRDPCLSSSSENSPISQAALKSNTADKRKWQGIEHLRRLQSSSSSPEDVSLQRESSVLGLKCLLTQQSDTFSSSIKKKHLWRNDASTLYRGYRHWFTNLHRISLVKSVLDNESCV